MGGKQELHLKPTIKFIADMFMHDAETLNLPTHKTTFTVTMIR